MKAKFDGNKIVFTRGDASVFKYYPTGIELKGVPKEAFIIMTLMKLAREADCDIAYSEYGESFREHCEYSPDQFRYPLSEDTFFDIFGDAE